MYPQFLSKTVRSPSNTTTLVVHPIAPGPDRHHALAPSEPDHDPVSRTQPCSSLVRPETRPHAAQHAAPRRPSVAPSGRGCCLGMDTQGCQPGEAGLRVYPGIRRVSQSPSRADLCQPPVSGGVTQSAGEGWGLLGGFLQLQPMLSLDTNGIATQATGPMEENSHCGRNSQDWVLWALLFCQSALLPHSTAKGNNIYPETFRAPYSHKEMGNRKSRALPVWAGSIDFGAKRHSTGCNV
ncbi:hypothetical protein DPEC_G00045790 [Dallia pectoralis]|uniref:Uncharacterized protein n=1 Tax=Dallia pectoralis TaxID=75939 RepID=A0ACC2HAA5_DALPE|nr:hypothetical protein DPEC_G00045790 [Dallia pectoralis]